MLYLYYFSNTILSSSLLCSRATTRRIIIKQILLLYAGCRYSNNLSCRYGGLYIRTINYYIMSNIPVVVVVVATVTVKRIPRFYEIQRKHQKPPISPNILCLTRTSSDTEFLIGESNETTTLHSLPPGPITKLFPVSSSVRKCPHFIVRFHTVPSKFYNTLRTYEFWISRKFPSRAPGPRLFRWALSLALFLRNQLEPSETRYV